MTDSFEEEFVGAEQRLLQACQNRTPMAFSKPSRDAILLHRLHMRLNQKTFLDWAIERLDAWGLSQALAPGSGWFVGPDLFEGFFKRVIELDQNGSDQGQALLDRAWPVLWEASDRQPYGLEVCWQSLYRRKRHRLLELHPARLNLEGGPFSEPFHSMGMSVTLYGLQPNNRGFHSARLTPIQLAWAERDMDLCLVLVDQGVGLRDRYEDSTWGDWSLWEALDGNIKSSIDPALNMAIKGWAAEPEIQARLTREVLERHLTQTLPPGMPTVGRVRM